MRIKVSQSLLDFEKLYSKKADLFVVGGFVRNSLLAINNSDVDLCGKLTISQLEKLCKNSKFSVETVSAELGTCKIKCDCDCWEYSTFRSEVYKDDGSHTPIKIKFIQDISQDAKRRDFTINSIYYNISKEAIFDPYNGVADLKAKKVRCIESPHFVFENDGLRILRMARISAELGFKVEKQTFSVAKKMSYKVVDITGTRKLDELLKILNSDSVYGVKSAHKKGLSLLSKLGLWQNIFSGAGKIRFDLCFKVEKDDRFIALLIDLLSSVKPQNISKYLSFILSQTGLSKHEISKIDSIVCGYFDALERKKNKEYFFKYFSCFEEISKFLLRKNCSIFKRYNFFYRYIINHKVPIQTKDLKINGNDLKNFENIPKKNYSQVLENLLNKVFDGKLKNEKQALLMEVENACNN